MEGLDNPEVLIAFCFCTLSTAGLTQTLFPRHQKLALPSAKTQLA